MTSTLETITSEVEVLANRREHLADLVGALNKGIEALKADAMPAVRAAIAKASLAWLQLEAAIADNPQLFDKPRTVSAHGIRFGLEKGKGSIEITNPDKTVELIERHLPDLADRLIDVRKTPIKDALAQLTAAELKRIGAELKGAGDQVVIRPSDGAVDKIVRALVKAAVDESNPQESRS